MRLLDDLRYHPFPPQALLDAPFDIPDLSLDAVRSQPGPRTDRLRLPSTK